MAHANGTREEKSFDALSRPVSILLKNSAGGVLRSESLTYLKSSQIDLRTVDGVTTDYDYDSAGRLTSEVRPGVSTGYAWDANSNRTSKTVNGLVQTALYDDGDKLLTISQGGSVVRSYAYDGAGRTTSVTQGGVSTGLVWNARGYVSQVGSQTYVINGEGARVKESGQAILRSGTGVTAPVISDGNATYTPGVSERRGSVSTFLHGGMKSVETQTSSSQNVSASRTYDAFGAVLSTGGSWQGPSGYGGTFGYREDASSFKLLGHRLYDPVAGRFLSRDPIRDGRNWYASCEGDPVNGADSEGLDTFIFNGKKVKHYDSAGNLVGTFPGTSGMPGSGPGDARKKSYGPIPPGTYYFKPWEIQRPTWNIGLWSDPGYYEPPFFGRNWGNRRVPLYPGPDTDTLGRGNFFIHRGVAAVCRMHLGKRR